MVVRPSAGRNPPLTRIVVGMHDLDSGLDLAAFEVTADFPLAGAEPGANLAGRFAAPGVWTMVLDPPLVDVHGRLRVQVRDVAGNIATVERTLSGRSRALKLKTPCSA